MKKPREPKTETPASEKKEGLAFNKREKKAGTEKHPRIAAKAFPSLKKKKKKK